MCDDDQSSAAFFVAGAIFGEVGVSPDAPRIVLDVSCVTRINHQRGRRSHW